MSWTNAQFPYIAHIRSTNHSGDDGFIDVLKTNFADRFDHFSRRSEDICQGHFLCECWGRVCIKSKGAGSVRWGVFTTWTQWHSVIRWPATVITGRFWDVLKSARRNSLIQGVSPFLFGSTYTCESSFSHISAIKTSNRASLTSQHPHHCMRFALTTYTPDFAALAKKNYI